MDKSYQVVILGGGPGGLSAGIYSARNKLSTLLIEKSMIGGLAIYADVIENYPGYVDGIGGMELGQLMHKQAEKWGMQTEYTEVTGLEVNGKNKIIKTPNGEVEAQTVIIALGSERLSLNVPGEKELVGKGVSYCATCDAAFFRNKPVAIVGGGNSAISEAIHLSKFASKVYIIHRRDQWRATPTFVDKAKEIDNIYFILNTTVDDIEGKDILECLRLNNVRTGEKSSLPVSGVFIAIGQSPNSQVLKGVVDLDERGYVITNDKMETSQPGIYAVGDIRSTSIRQTISAAGDGATAAIYADRYIGGQ